MAEPTHVDVVHRFDDARGAVKAVEIDRYDALTLAERPVDPDPEQVAEILTEAWLKRGPREEHVQILRRLRFAGISADGSQLVRRARARVRSPRRDRSERQR